SGIHRLGEFAVAVDEVASDLVAALVRQGQQTGVHHRDLHQVEQPVRPGTGHERVVEGEVRVADAACDIALDRSLQLVQRLPDIGGVAPAPDDEPDRLRFDRLAHGVDVIDV